MGGQTHQEPHRRQHRHLPDLIDATAAPVCIIAPISSWAAAVSGTVEGVNGIQLFISTIPYNLYAILTLIMVVFISVSNMDYGPMRTHEINAINGDLFTTRNSVYDKDDEPTHTKGKVIDLVLPVIVLICFCVIGMLYSGGLFSGENLIDAFANCDASLGLSLGSIGALIVIMIYFMLRRVLKFTDWRCGICQRSGRECYRCPDPPADDPFPRRARSFFRDRHLLGHLWYSHPDRHRRVQLVSRQCC